MEHFIIILLAAFSSTSAFAQPNCDHLTDSVFVCFFDGTTGLEIFEDSDSMQIEHQYTSTDGLIINKITTPSLIGFDLDIKNCISEVLGNEATATCVLNDSDFSTARLKPQNNVILLPAPQKTVIKRVDRR